MNALWVFGEIVDSLAAILFLALGLSGSLYAYGFVGPGPFRRFRWRAEHRATLRWLAPLLVVLSVGALLLQVRELRTSRLSPIGELVWLRADRKPVLVSAPHYTVPFWSDRY